MKLLPLLLIALAPLSSFAEDHDMSAYLEEVFLREDAPFCYESERVGGAGRGPGGERVTQQTIDAAKKRGCINIRRQGDYVFAECPVRCAY
jgi:hypothetical protein